MSAARDGDWHLLGYDTDPVPAEASGLDDVIRHYETITTQMETQAKLLKKIGDGDETLLKGWPPMPCANGPGRAPTR
nr:hypothetical protein GCM10025730_50740 [Promicromonospora thailandica]